MIVINIRKNILEHGKGFTIVELLVVIVVIAILAAITIVSYNGIQARSQDSQRKMDVANIAKLIKLSEVEHGNEGIGRNSGCGGSGHGSGYYSGLYESYRGIWECLVDLGYSSAADIGDPSGCDAVNSPSCHRFDGKYMVVVCEKDGALASYVLAKLKTTANRPDLMQEICDPDTVLGWANGAQTWSRCEELSGNYCLNYAVRAY